MPTDLRTNLGWKKLHEWKSGGLQLLMVTRWSKLWTGVSEAEDMNLSGGPYISGRASADALQKA